MEIIDSWPSLKRKISIMQNSALCRKCMQGSIIVGPNRLYNSKLKNGTVVCVDCKLKEIMKEVVQWPNQDMQSINS